jgi:RNA polymerase sigma-70 factor (ECF subfamily)
MDEREWLASEFETRRTHLRKVTYRMLGSPSEADDASDHSGPGKSRNRVANLPPTD